MIIDQAIHTIFFDFDGVFTNNKVYVNENGEESVRCDRADGLGIDILRGFLKTKKIPLDYFILSKERNKVVEARAKKLRVPCIYGVDDKASYLIEHFKNNKALLDGVVYVGNDLNDLQAMKISGFSYAPKDAHPLITQSAQFVMPRNGGDGFVRAVIEHLIGSEMNQVLNFLEDYQ